MDFTTYKFRCSSLGKLMTEARSKSETLSETTKTYLRELFIEEVFGRKKDFSNKFTEKGLYTEEDSLELMQNHYGKLIIKNKELFENEYIKGTPDIILSDRIADAKSSWDIFTFFGADGTDKNYYWQLQGYMWLVGRQNADLVYCLNNAPEHQIVQEKSKRMYQRGLIDGTVEFNEMELEVEKDMIFDDIPAQKRIKVFSFEADGSGIDALINRIMEARGYLNQLFEDYAK